MTNHSSQAAHILSTIPYLTLATASKTAKPWNSPVAYFRDNSLNLYWFSAKDSVHSQNIRENPDVFIIIYDSTMPEGTGLGLYIEATAEEINDETEAARIATLQTGTMAVQPQQCLGDAIHRFYKATPTRLWVNDDEKDESGKYVKDIRVEVEIEDIKRMIR